MTRTFLLLLALSTAPALADAPEQGDASEQT